MIDTGAFPVVIGFVIFVAILVPNILLLITYRKYRRISKLLPDPGAIGRTQPKTIDAKRGALASFLLDDWKKLPDGEIEVTRHALWTAMLLEAASDGNIDHREMQFVADLFGRMAGSEMDFRPVIQSAELVHNDKRSALSEIAKAREVSDASKAQILAGAFLVSVSDHTLSERETDCLGDIADALAIGRRDRKAMFAGITKRFGV